MTDAATPETATASQPLDLHGAARAIEGLLARDKTPERSDRRRQRRAADTADPEGGPDAEEAPDAESADDGPDDDPDAEADDPDAPEEAEEADEQPRFTVKIDGEEQEVTLSELLKGYQRGADYTRKTMRLGDERRELRQARERAEQGLAAAETERQHYAQQLGAFVPNLRQQMLAQFAGIDWERLAAEDPARFAVLGPIYETMTTQLRQAEAAQLRLRERQRQGEVESQEARRRYRDDQWRAVVDRNPEFGDPAKARRESQALSGYLLKAGYRREELDRLVDHRDFILARKAMLYDRMTEARGKIAGTPAPPTRLQRPGIARGRGEGAKERRAALLKRLDSTGRVEDAARLIEDMF